MTAEIEEWPSPAAVGAFQGVHTTLPAARSVLAVVARPGDEVYYLGAVLDAFGRAGSTVSVLAFSRGDASPYNESMEHLDTIRLLEFDAAVSTLRADHCLLADYAEADLHRLPIARLAERVIRSVREWGADILLTVDGRMGDRVAACVACQAGRELTVPVLAWTLPHEVARRVRKATGLSVTGDPGRRIDFQLRVRRTVQRNAISAHGSQCAGEGTHLARLVVQGDREWLRWLVPVTAAGSAAARG